MRIPVLAAAALLVTSAHAAEIITPNNSIPNRYIVVLQEEPEVQRMTTQARVDRASRVGSEVMTRSGGRMRHVFQRALHGFVADFDELQVRAMARDPRVRFIEQDAVVHIAVTETNATWGLDRIDQRDRPVDRLYTYFASGAGVHAYVIDTGILATHQEFTGRVGNGFAAIADGRGTQDCNGHGTHVSGTLGGTVFGVAKRVTLHPVRVLDCNGGGTTSGVIQGVDWVTQNHVAPAVANMSLGGGISTALDEAVRNSIASGVVYAVAAGNENANACNGSPSRVGQALTVGASTNVDARASFSNFGACVDLFAPGQTITSAWLTSNTATRVLSGTSMASPHVAGAAALVLETNRTATAVVVAQTIVNNASLNKLANIGAGSPNRLLFTLAATPTPTPTPTPGPDPVPVAAFVSSCTGLVCSFNASGSTDNAPISVFNWNFGDGQTAAGAIASHTFAAAGTFNVVLSVTDTVGQVDTETRSVTVTSVNPVVPCTACERFTGTLEAGAVQFQPNGTFYLANVAGTHRGWLRGPAGLNFNLALLRWNGVAWQIVAGSNGATATEQITFTGPAGFYAWRINSVSGQGTYDFFLQRP